MGSSLFWLFSVFVVISHCQQPPLEPPPIRIPRQENAATTAFAMELFKKIASKPDAPANVFYSPLSVYVALGMLYAGSKGNTASELEAGLRWSLLSESTNTGDGHDAMKKLTEEIFRPLSKNNTLDVANKLWLQKYFCTVKCDNFIQTLKSNYSAELGKLNFASGPEGARREINKWVEKKTNNKIKDLMPAGSVNTLTRFVLTNAIYFKSTWKHQFNPEETSNRQFTALGKDGPSTTQVPMMRSERKFRTYLRDRLVDVIDIPYTVEELSMVVAVPRDFRGIRKLEQTLNADTLRRWTENLDVSFPYKTTLFLPKFKVETDVKLKSFLQEMGMKDVFNPQVADLSGITGYKGLFVSTAVHKAYVNVDEEGTEAAAATGIGIALSSLAFRFVVDKPFIFFIRHKPTNTILFMGRIKDPSSK